MSSAGAFQSSKFTKAHSCSFLRHQSHQWVYHIIMSWLIQSWCRLLPDHSNALVMSASTFWWDSFKKNKHTKGASLLCTEQSKKNSCTWLSWRNDSISRAIVSGGSCGRCMISWASSWPSISEPPSPTVINVFSTSVQCFCKVSFDIPWTYIQI